MSEPAGPRRHWRPNRSAVERRAQQRRAGGRAAQRPLAAPTDAESRPGWALPWQPQSWSGLEETVIVRTTGAKNTLAAKHQLLPVLVLPRRRRRRGSRRRSRRRVRCGCGWPRRSLQPRQLRHLRRYIYMKGQSLHTPYRDKLFSKGPPPPFMSPWLLLDVTPQHLSLPRQFFPPGSLRPTQCQVVVATWRCLAVLALPFEQSLAHVLHRQGLDSRRLKLSKMQRLFQCPLPPPRPRILCQSAASRPRGMQQ